MMGEVEDAATETGQGFRADERHRGTEELHVEDEQRVLLHFEPKLPDADVGEGAIEHLAHEEDRENGPSPAGGHTARLSKTNATASSVTAETIPQKSLIRRDPIVPHNHPTVTLFPSRADFIGALLMEPL
jgi:hypothetical protein